MSECLELWDWQKQKALYTFSYSLTFIEAFFSTPVFYLALTPRWTTWGSVVAQRYFEAVRDQTTNFQISRWPVLPPELQLPHCIYYLNYPKKHTWEAKSNLQCWRILFSIQNDQSYLVTRGPLLKHKRHKGSVSASLYSFVIWRIRPYVLCNSSFHSDSDMSCVYWTFSVTNFVYRNQNVTFLKLSYVNLNNINHKDIQTFTFPGKLD